jgi:hypothetical protein
MSLPVIVKSDTIADFGYAQIGMKSSQNAGACYDRYDKDKRDAWLSI